MVDTTFSRFVTVIKDQFTPSLERCATHVQTDTSAQKQALLISFKLDLRAIQEVETMEGYASDEDFDELLFMPKVQDFLALIHHHEQITKSFWLLLRMRYLGILQRQQRAQVIQFNHQFCYQPTALLREFYKLSTVPERLRFLSHLSYYDFAAFITESDLRALPLNANNNLFLPALTASQSTRNAKRSGRSSYLAR